MDEYPIIDLSQLLSTAQGLARLPADERIQRILANRWIGFPRAVEALNRLETLYAWPNKQRMPNLLPIGSSNNGNSMIIEKFRRTPPASYDADQENIPVLVVQMSSEPSMIRSYVALLAAMGASLRPRPRLPEMEQLALALLRKVGVRTLVIDELHNVLAGNSVNRREFLNLLRFLGNELRIPLVGVGTREAHFAIRADVRRKLEQQSRGRSTAARVVLHSRIVLLAAGGLQNKQIADTLKVAPRMVTFWRGRFLEQGIAGLLKDAPRPGRAPSIMPEVTATLIAKTTQSTPAHAMHWSTRTMAREMGVSKASVSSIWRANGLKPHRVESFKVSNDQLFADKLEAIVGLYLNPSEHALVLSVDEKSQI